MGTTQLTTLIAIIMAVFMIMPVFLIFYALAYRKRKKKDHLEKQSLKTQFDLEILKTQQEVKEQTLQTIGADLHDNIGQLLSLTALTLKSIPEEPAHAGKVRIDTSIDLLSRSIRELRLLGKLIQGDQLVAMGLIHAIQQEVEWLQKSGAFKISCTLPEEISPSDPQKDLVLFRILQELLQNIIKHAGANSILIHLAGNPKEMTLRVSDNGIGFDPVSTTAEKGMGLANIQKRTELLGGTLELTSSPHGSTFTITLPYGKPTD